MRSARAFRGSTRGSAFRMRRSAAARASALRTRSRKGSTSASCRRAARVPEPRTGPQRAFVPSQRRRAACALLWRSASTAEQSRRVSTRRPPVPARGRTPFGIPRAGRRPARRRARGDYAHPRVEVRIPTNPCEGLSSRRSRYAKRARAGFRRLRRGACFRPHGGALPATALPSNHRARRGPRRPHFSQRGAVMSARRNVR